MKIRHYIIVLVVATIVLLGLSFLTGCSNTPFNKNSNLEGVNITSKLITPVFSWEQSVESIKTEQTIDEAEQISTGVSNED